MSQDPAHTRSQRSDLSRAAVVLSLIAAPFVAFPSDFVPKALLDGGDDLVANIPQLVYSARKLLEGEILWTPSLWMGQPILGEPEFATFYLPKLFLLLGPPVVAYAAYVLLHYLAAEIGAYLYLKSLGIGRVGAVFGALAYAYSGFMIGHRGHTMYVCAGAWTPFVLLCFDRAEEKPRGSSYLLAAATFAAVPLCGAVQLTVYLAGVLLLVAALRSFFERKWKPLIDTVLCLAPGVLLSSVQLAPSWDLTHQLATDTRATPEVQSEHSFHPLLLPTLLLPVAPHDVELYSRIGAIACCATVVAIPNLRSAPTRVRAWAVAAAVSLVLMLGHHVPFSSAILQRLPVVGLLRGASRHNFELGLSASVLSAYGVELAHSRVARISRAWLIGVPLVLLACWGAVRVASSGFISDADASEFARWTGSTSFLGAAFAFALWLLSLGARSPSARRVVWAAVAVAPALETAWAMRIEARPNPSAIGLFEAASDALPKTGRARVLSVSLRRASVDALVGNSVLLLPGAESLQGYSSIAYGSARELLELDMHGQPVFYDELSFSILPSIFGVTHLALPNTVCEGERFSLTSGRELCGRGEAQTPIDTNEPAEVRSGELGCAALSTRATRRYRLEASARAQTAESLGVSFHFLEARTGAERFGLEIPGARVGPDPFREVWPVRLTDAESWGVFWLKNRRTGPVEVSSTGLYVERDATVEAFGPLNPADLSLEDAVASPDFIRLVPSGETASLEKFIRFPARERRNDGVAVLEVEARTTSAAPRDLVVGLRDAHAGLPDAELSIRGVDLGREWRPFRREVRLQGAPEELLVRAVANGGGSVDLREIRLSRPSEERVYGYPIALNRYPAHARIEGERMFLEGGARMIDRVYLPVRAFEVVLDAQAESPIEGPVHFGLTAPTRYDEPREWGIEPPALEGRVRAHHVSILPPDIREARLFVRNEGAAPLRVHELSATDACMLRGYRNPRPLANGLFLYENPHALPRAYTVSRTVFGTSPRAVRQILLDTDPSHLGETAVVGAEMPKDLKRGTILQEAFGQRTNDLIVRTEDGPTLLVVNERFDPNWRATIDGTATVIVPVNALVRGVVVPRGEHRVHLEYRAPRAVWVGLALSIVGLFVALLGSPAVSRRVRRAQSRSGRISTV